MPKKSDTENRKRWHHYRTIPQSHWEKMSGRQRKTLKEQAITYEIPFGGAKINLLAVVPALHDFLVLAMK